MFGGLPLLPLPRERWTKINSHSDQNSIRRTRRQLALVLIWFAFHFYRKSPFPPPFHLPSSSHFFNDNFIPWEFSGDWLGTFTVARHLDIEYAIFGPYSPYRLVPYAHSFLIGRPISIVATWSSTPHRKWNRHACNCRLLRFMWLFRRSVNEKHLPDMEKNTVGWFTHALHIIFDCSINEKLMIKKTQERKHNKCNIYRAYRKYTTWNWTMARWLYCVCVCCNNKVE